MKFLALLPKSTAIIIIIIITAPQESSKQKQDAHDSRLKPKQAQHGTDSGSDTAVLHADT